MKESKGGHETDNMKSMVKSTTQRWFLNAAKKYREEMKTAATDKSDEQGQKDVGQNTADNAELEDVNLDNDDHEDDENMAVDEESATGDKVDE